jgi:hypothetical protein
LRRFISLLFLLTLVLRGFGPGTVASESRMSVGDRSLCSAAVADWVPLSLGSLPGRRCRTTTSRCCPAIVPDYRNLAPSAQEPRREPKPWPVAALVMAPMVTSRVLSMFGQPDLAALPVNFLGPLAWTCVLRI